jgi:hypothetical protein
MPKRLSERWIGCRASRIPKPNPLLRMNNGRHAMARIGLLHIKVTKKVLADGSLRVFRYHRKTGRRILGEPGTPDFMASYAEAARTAPAVTDRDTLGGLIGRYKASRSFGDAAPSTRRMYDFYLQQIVIDWGDMPIGALDDRRIRGDIIAEHDRRAETARRSADYWLATLRRVISYGHDIGVLNNNHALRIEKAHRADRSDKIWLPELCQEGVYSPCCTRDEGGPFEVAL